MEEKEELELELMRLTVKSRKKRKIDFGSPIEKSVEILKKVIRKCDPETQDKLEIVLEYLRDSDNLYKPQFAVDFAKGYYISSRNCSNI